MILNPLNVTTANFFRVIILKLELLTIRTASTQTERIVFVAKALIKPLDDGWKTVLMESEMKIERGGVRPSVSVRKIMRVWHETS